jgi:protein-S-isoprenylcysteine O-methyltransferase Ste14
MIEQSHAPWWTGTRGEWYVVAQVAFIVLVLFGPRTWPGGVLLSFPYPRLASIAGVALIVSGLVLMTAGGLWLGRNLTPLPHPTATATLVETGPFRLVRHPMYSGGMLIAFGWAIWVRGPLTTGYAVLVLVFLDIKSRREEQWLRERFAAYAAYQKRVAKLIPFVY